MNYPLVGLYLGYGLLVSMLASFVMVGWVARLARRLKIMDHPDSRKVHEAPIPLLGGLGWILALTAVILSHYLAFPWVSEFLASYAADLAFALPSPSLERSTGPLVAIGIGLVGIVTLGILDDVRTLSPRWMLLGQVAVALFAASQGLRPEMYGIPWLSWTIAVLWTVTLINAWNMLDSLDGLLSGIGIIVLSAMTAIALSLSKPTMALLLVLIIGVLIGYLGRNWTPAHVFQGSSGSMSLGFLVSQISLLLHYTASGALRNQVSSLLIPVILMAVPLLDIVGVVVIRLRQRQSPFRGDRNHLPHLALRQGFSRRRVVALMWVLTFCTSFGAIMLLNLTDTVAAIYLIQVLGILVFIRLVVRKHGAGGSVPLTPSTGTASQRLRRAHGTDAWVLIERDSRRAKWALMAVFLLMAGASVALGMVLNASFGDQRALLEHLKPVSQAEAARLLDEHLDAECALLNRAGGMSMDAHQGWQCQVIEPVAPAGEDAPEGARFTATARFSRHQSLAPEAPTTIERRLAFIERRWQEFPPKLEPGSGGKNP